MSANVEAVTDAGMATWRRFVMALASAVALLMLSGIGLIVWADPFGLRQPAGAPARPMLDSNQRFMFPQLVRARRADAVVLGTSSVKLLDPVRIEASTGLTTLNLAMNAATPWEQTQVLSLIRREGKVPRLLIWGLDTTWCEPDATSPAKQRTPRPFPDWLFARASLRDLPHSVSFTTLEIAARRLPELSGKVNPRIRADGYDEFTPPDASYDVARARFHLFGKAPVEPLAPTPPVPLPLVASAELDRFPALVWLQEALAARNPETTVVLILPPVHAFSQPAVATDLVCKASIAAIARQRGAGLLDYRFRSPLTVRDENFWDPLHYRTSIAATLVDAITRMAIGQPPAGNDNDHQPVAFPATPLPAR